MPNDVLKVVDDDYVIVLILLLDLSRIFGIVPQAYIFEHTGRSRQLVI